MEVITLIYDNFDDDKKSTIRSKNKSRLAKLLEEVPDRINLDGLDFRFKLLSNYDKKDEYSIFVFEIAKLNFSTCLDDLSLEIINQLRAHNIPIFVFFDSEGFGFEDRSFWVDCLQHQFTKHGLEKNLKFLCFSTVNTQYFYDKHIEKFSKIDRPMVDINFFRNSHKSKFTKCFGGNLFEYYYPFPDDNKIDKVRHQLLDPHKKVKDFLCFNRNLRGHRLALVSELYRNNLQQRSIITLTSGPMMPIPSDGALWEAENILKDAKQIHFFREFMSKWTPIGEQVGFFDMFVPSEQYYIDTFFSLVTETEVKNESLFVTEKTSKPITWLHPFIILGSPYTLKYLRSLGYETFPEIFNESYDEEEVSSKRFDMIRQQILTFCSLTSSRKIVLFQSVIDKLKHNRKMWNERYTNRHLPIINAFKNILDIIKNENNIIV